MKINAYAKVNLFLDVVGKLENGYHEIVSVMQTVSLCDTLTLEKTNGEITLSCDGLNIEKEKNIVYLAAKKFFEKVGGGVGILLEKRIPEAAGLGGGSADAAATLCALNTLYNHPYTQEKLLKMAATLGADVPFCLVGGTALCEGIGEKITPLKPIPKLYVVIAKNGVKESTAKMYGEIDKLSSYTPLNIQKFTTHLNQKKVEEAFLYSGNIFEQFYGEAELGCIKKQMLYCGAFYSGLSGAGPSVIGLFATKKDAESCHKQLIEQKIQSYLCETV